jgi:pyruvate kinase
VERRAKIVVTLGPASAGRAAVRRLLAAGADVVRLNLSHGDRDQHRRLLSAVREEAAARGEHVPVLADLMGPRYRLGTLAEPRLLRRGERVALAAEAAGGVLPIDDPDLLRHLAPGERVLIDNGLVELEVEARRGRQVRARVVAGGTVSTRKGINLPDTDLPFQVSEKDRDDVAFAVAAGVDYLGVSYVGAGADLAAVRRLAGGGPLLVAKLERAAAVDRLDEILAAADAVMVARGDLGVEVPLDQVPVLQKRIIAAARDRGMPVIVATQMLESMIERPRPTRAEATDVANAVLDGADALMLSGETAVGRYAVETVRTMARIVVTAERYRAEEPPRAGWPQPGGPPTGDGPRPAHRRGGSSDPRRAVADVVCAAAAHAADQLGAGSIVAFSQGGFTARSLARYRPRVPILVFTTDPAVARQVQLVWGVRPLLMEGEVRRLDQVVEVVERRLRAARLARRGEAVVLVMGDPISERPLTNLMRVHRLAS